MGVVLTLANVRTPLQMLLLLLFLAVAPTTAVAGLLRGLDIFARFLMAATATIIINSLVAEMTLYAGAWSPRTQLIAIVLITATAAVVQLPPIRAAVIARLSVRRPAKAHDATQAVDADGSEPVADAPGESQAEQACAFADIWAEFADLRQALGLPIQNGYPSTDPSRLHPVPPRNQPE